MFSLETLEKLKALAEKSGNKESIELIEILIEDCENIHSATRGY